MNIEITKQKGIKLKTGGKLCEEDIIVSPKLQSKTATSKGTITPDNGYAGLSSVDVQVEDKAPVLQEKSVEIKANGNVDIEPDSGYDGLSKATVKVEVPIPEGYIVPEGKKDITSNGTHSVTEYSEVEVSVNPKLQSKEVTPKDSQQTISPDSSYDGLSSVTVEAVPTEEKTATSNGTVLPSPGKFLSKVTVIVPNESDGEDLAEYEGSVQVSGAPVEDNEGGILKCQEKIITKNGVVTPDEGYDGLSRVSVNVSIPEGYIQPSGELEVTQNGIFNVKEYENVVINVPGEVVTYYNNIAEVY